jgi:hypothetical protein
MKVLSFLGFGCSVIVSTAAGQSGNYIASSMVRNEATAFVKQNPPSPKKMPSPVRWERTSDVKTGDVDKRSYKELVNQSLFLAAFLQDSCLSLAGMQAVWHGEFTAQGKAVDRQLSSTLVGEFFPGPAEGSGDHLRLAELRVAVNDPHLLYRDTLVINNKLYPILTATPVPRDGSLYFAAPADSQHVPEFSPLSSGFWLVLGNNMPPPYLPLTRKEYLTEATQELLAEKAIATERTKQQFPLRSESVQKADKEAAMSAIEQTCSGAQLQIRMRAFLAQYKSDETQQQEAVAAATSGLDSTLHIMAQLLATLPPAELERPAFVSVQADAFQGFEDMISEYGMLVKPNPLYHGCASGSIVPNLFIVCMTGNGANGPSGAEDQAGVPFTPEKLKSLLK